MTDVMVLGADGYTGWPLTCSLLERGDDVVGVDDFSKRRRAPDSVTPIADPWARKNAVEKYFDGDYRLESATITNRNVLPEILDKHEPDTIVNLAQIPAAPYSMESFTTAWETQANNIRGSLNLYWALHELGLDSHVIQLATMGEYPVHEQIPEGFMSDGRPAPKSGGSLYHCSKINTTVNTQFLANTWDIPTTEVYQGIVFGVSMFEAVDERLVTRYNADGTWGTVLNRFVAQAAAGHPLTVYGDGGQKRAMLSLADCVQCLTLAVDNPPEEYYPYRAINQFDGSYRVKEVAEIVADVVGGVEIAHIDNPRQEDESEHVYDPEREVLDRLGYEPTRSIEEEVARTYGIIEEWTHRIDESTLEPDVAWDDNSGVPDYDLPDGAGCTEAWEATSDHREE